MCTFDQLSRLTQRFTSHFKSDNLTFRLYSAHAPRPPNNDKNREKTAHLKYVSACATMIFTWRINAVRSTLWHGSDAPDLAFVLASGSRMQLRMRILSSGSLASAFEMSTLRPWPRPTSAHSALLGYSMTGLLSSLMSDSEGQNPC